MVLQVMEQQLENVHQAIVIIDAFLLGLVMFVKIPLALEKQKDAL